MKKTSDYNEKYCKELERNKTLMQDNKMLKRENGVLKEELENANKKIEEYSLLLVEALKIRGVRCNR